MDTTGKCSSLIRFTMDKSNTLIHTLLQEGALRSLPIVRAFHAIDRGDFVPRTEKRFAYKNTPLPIGYGQTISQPYTVVFMLELLDPRE